MATVSDPMRAPRRRRGLVLPALLAVALWAPSAFAAGSPPVNTERPALSGSARYGQGLTATQGTWTGDKPITFTNQWVRCDTAGANCVNIASATGLTYTLGLQDIGSRVYIRVTASNAAGTASTRSWLSATIVSAPVNTQRPALSGTARVGQALVTSTGTWAGTQPFTYAYQWRRCDADGSNCADIAGAAGGSYALVTADVGKRVHARVTASNAYGGVAERSWNSAVVDGTTGGAVRYVSPNGSDANPGTEAQPWRTPQKAMDAMNPGDTTYVKAGTYGRTVCDSSTGDGGSASGGYVTIRAYAADRPVLTASTDGVLAIDCDYLRVEGLVIAGPGVVAGTLVYGMTDSDHVQLVRNEVRGSVCQGIYTEEETADYEIRRNWIHDNGTSACDRQAHGIYLQGDRHLVANNVIHDHPFGFGIQNYDYSRNVRIIGNTITHAAHGGLVIGGGGCGPSGCNVAGTAVVGNILAYNRTYGIDRDSTGPTSCSIHHNLAFQNGSGSYDSGWPSGCLGSNATADPRFVNVSARDLHVQSGSPAIDAGDPAYVFSPDFDGMSRPQGSAPDVGAFER